jgi:hypothetical protein
LATVLGVLALAACFSGNTIAQQADNQGSFGPGRNERDQPKTVRDFLAKRRAEKAKKDYEELLQRGDELLQLTAQLETAYERNKDLTAADLGKLEAVEKLAEKIRKSMGGDDDGEDDDPQALADPGEKPVPPAGTEEAVVDLKEMAVKLVDELKKTSRFGISVAAIQTSNSVLKLAKFLRLKK